jgi:amino acid permease
MKRCIAIIIIVSLAILILIVGLLVGCNESDKVSSNLSKEADNFNVVRKLTVINCIGNDVLFQMTGKISITADTTDKQLEILVEDEEGQYQKHFVGLSDNVTYIVEQVKSKKTEKYKYTLNFNPKMWIPVIPKVID